MAVFFKNDCKFNGCGLKFSTLSALIEHIEATHIDFDPNTMEAYEDTHPISIPFSYVLRYSQTPIKPMRENGKHNVKLRLLHHANKSLGEKHHGGQQNGDNNTESESESSNDSWKPSKEVTTFERKSSSICYFKDKPFACSVPGCTKRYKNINGIRYHHKNGHKPEQRPKKGGFKYILNKKTKNVSSKKIQQHNLQYVHPILNTSTNSYTIGYRSEEATWIEENPVFGNYEGIENVENYLSLFNGNVNANANVTWSTVPMISNNNESTIMKSITDSPNSTYTIFDF